MSKGIPNMPTAEFAQSATIELEALEDDWLPLQSAIENIRQRLSELDSLVIPETEESAPEVEEELNASKSKLSELTAVLETLQQEFSTYSQDKIAIEKRLSALRLDLKRNQDALKLQKLGSVLGKVAADRTCPTCHQEVTAELFPTASTVGMAVEENIAFLKSQIDLYASTLRGLEVSMREARANYHAINEKLKRVRRRIRELKESLVQPSSSLSRARIEEIVQLQNRYDYLTSLQQSVDGLTDELRAIATAWAKLQTRLGEISGPDLSPRDEEKIGYLRATLREHLDRYGFRSFHTSEIDLAEDSFRPLVRTIDKEGRLVERELGFEVSASDAIRLKWAYYLTLLSMSHAYNTNHPGLLILDEPGQQEIESESFVAFLRWAAANIRNEQLILATSEKRTLIEDAIREYDCNLISFGELILRPL
jgi:chromosome segregation ATPase